MPFGKRVGGCGSYTTVRVRGPRHFGTQLLSAGFPPKKGISTACAKRPNREKHSQQAPFPVVGMWIALRRSAPGDSIRFDPRFPVRSVFGGGVPLSLSLPRIPGSAVSFRSPFVPGWSRGRWEKPTRPSAPVKQISHFLVDPTAFWGCVFSGSFHTC